MTELIFIEGISGVGKSTMVRSMAAELVACGYKVKKYVEFDYTNPIDFYCTAYLTKEEYEELCVEYKQHEEAIRTNTIWAEDARLVRYYDEDTPLFDEPLLSELAQKEFCYNPIQLVPLDKYTAAYRDVWKNFATSLDDTYDFIIFDGSLLHHPINDMMRNYNVTSEQALSHVSVLLNALGQRKRSIFYLKTDDIAGQLTRAHIDRRQDLPTDNQVRFWTKRYKKDMAVLDGLTENYQIYDVSSGTWEEVRAQIIQEILERHMESH